MSSFPEEPLHLSPSEGGGYYPATIHQKLNNDKYEIVRVEYIRVVLVCFSLISFLLIFFCLFIHFDPYYIIGLFNSHGFLFSSLNFITKVET